MSEQIEDIFDPKNSYHIMSAHSGTEDSIYNMIVRRKTNVSYDVSFF